MRSTMKNFINFCLLSFFIACGNSPKEVPPEPDLYTQTIDNGWDAFSEQNYTEAQRYFSEAKALNNERFGAFVGLGWVYLMQDSIELAETAFKAGTKKTGAVGEPDLFAGWAFALNLIDDFESSTIQAKIAIELDSGWEFAKGTTINVRMLYLLLAENNFLSGNFLESLVWVQKLHPGFTVDIFSSSGQGLLAQEIERLSNASG